MTAKKAPTAIEIVYQDLAHLEEVTSNLGGQIQRVQRVMKLDVLENAIADKQSANELLHAVARNSAIVAEMIDIKHEEMEDPSDMGFYHRLRRSHQTARGKRLMHVKELSSYNKEVTPVCPCGEHMGIRFVDNGGNPVQELCPKAWWVSLSRLAYEEHGLGQFLESTPLDVYIRPYKLTDKVG